MALNLRGSFLRPHVSVVYIAAVLFVAISATAQSTGLRPRITAAIDPSNRTTLVGSRSPRATTANDTGVVAPDLPLQGITLVFSRTPAQKTALDQLVAAQQNPASPLYHRWLNPDQFAAQFGVADADITTVSSWLEREGFVVGAVSRSRNRISFSGTAGQVAAAFGAALHNYKGRGETSSQMAPSADLSIPAALGSIVHSIGNLSTFRPHSNVVIPSPRPQPQYTAGGNQVAYLVPPDVATIYDVNPAYGAGNYGNGQTIAIVGQSAVLAQDLANFQTALGVSIQPQTLHLVPGTGASTIKSGDELESDLDLEYSAAMAPGALVSFYYVGNSRSYNAFDSIVYVIDNDLAGIISVSYASCEPNMGSAGIAALDLSLEQAAVQGQTVVVAAGDYGSVSCAENALNSPVVQHAPAVNYPASSPWVVAMGGTQFPDADLGDPVNPTYWESSNGELLSSARSYIPEQVWNENGAGLSEGGGGTSIFEPQPLWQTGVPGISTAGFRLVPDISLASSANHPGYLLCTSDPMFAAAGSCANGFLSAAYPLYIVIGGTSVAAPIFAGLVAVLNQAKGYTAGQGLINPTLYTLASESAIYTAAFHDITSGDNECSFVSVCGTGPQNTDYAAGDGYDQASGLGSIDFAALLAAWPQNTETPAVSTTTTLNVSSQNMQYGMPLALTATVSSGTGSVAFYNNGASLGSAPLNSDGVAILIPTAYSMPPGADSITATYVGNTGYGPSTSTAITVNVAVAPTVLTYTVSPAHPTYGSAVTFDITVTSNGNPMTGTGFVWFQNNGQGIDNGVMNYSPTGEATLSISTLPVGTNSITATFEGTIGYAPSTPVTTLVNVAPSPTFTTVTASPTTPVLGSSVTLAVTVAADGLSVTDGAVTFFSGGASIGMTTVSDGMASLSLSSLPAGSHSITASYSGTTNFSASTSTALVVVVAPMPTTTTLSTSTANPVFGSPVTLTATVYAGSNPALSGTVSFLNGSTVIGTGTVSSGVATLVLSNLMTGANSIHAAYAGTLNFGASASSVVTVTVAPLNTAISLNSSTTASSYGASVTLTAIVSAGDAPAATGVVTFLDGTSAIATGAVNSGGVATVSLSTLPTGSNSITASYAGTTNLAASVSSAIRITVAPASTTTVLSASSATAAYGAGVTLSAAVNANGAPAATGVVTFFDGAASIGTGTLQNGIATISLSTLPSGSNSITASYAGTTNLAASASNVVLVTVAPAAPAVAATTTTLSVSSSTATSGDMVTFTVIVTSGNQPVTAGVVELLEDGNPIASGTMNSSGCVTIALSTLPAGSNSISAYYAGTANFATSLSSSLTETVTAPANPVPPATITVATPSPVSPGSATTAAVSLVASSSYSGTMNLTCTLTSSPAGAQYLPTCSLTPPTLTIAANASASSILTVKTTSTTTSAGARPSGLIPWSLGGASAMAGLLMFCVPNRRRRTMALCSLLLVTLCFGAAGCGSARLLPLTTAAETTTAGNYTFTVKGVDASNQGATVSTVVLIAVQ